ncbi:hypothetical protein O181_049114 [Austropuccinia psidii MF-1]|uniref:Uncharacterized protein n=1 Tax=Austropuccinia psidii MF-1 TaxID=1389203 RepID=A0A9Q3DU99_9BASI|nr:hypothetical protein [Austropuccinia psidii MF-1]
MSSKLTALTESSLSAPPPSVLHGSGIISRFSSPSMASSGYFDPTKIYDGYKAVKFLDTSSTKCLAKGKEFFEYYNPRSSKCHYCFIGKKRCHQTGKQASNIRRYLWMTGSRQRDVTRWTNVGGPIPVGGRPIYSCSEVPISRINTEGIVKRIILIANAPPDPNAEVSDELDGAEVEVIPHSSGHPSNGSPSQPPAKRFQSKVIPSTTRSFQPTLATIPTSIPPASPHYSHTRLSLNTEVRPSPIQQSRNSPIGSMAYPVTREDPNTARDNQDSVASLFRRADRNSREVIMYANNRTIPGTASEEMAEKFAWYEDELIDDFQKTFDHLGRDK